MALVAAAAILAYANSFRIPLLLDDQLAIVQNPSIRHLWPLSDVLRPPDYSGTSGRPLLNLSFALNYAAGGQQVEGYHLVNLGLLIAGAWTLFGVARRALRSPAAGPRFTEAADWLAAVIAGLWAIHPLQTESVSYVSQRAESLAGLFYLLTLYGLVRGAENRPHAGRWLIVSAACCWLGLGAKEIVVTAPAVVFAFDAIFVAGSATQAWRRRKVYYLSLVASWAFLALLMGALGKHSVGFHQGVGSFEYLLTECQAIGRYLQLSVWPAPLVFDYGPVLVSHPLAVLPQGLVILVLLTGTGLLVPRRPALAFLGIWFFFILAPTSSVVPVALQPIAENRMYLPLAAIVTGLVLLVYHRIGTASRWLFGAAAVLLIAATLQRNRVYATEHSIWADTVSKRPHNPRALDNYGNVLLGEHRLPEAIRCYQAALALTPRVGRMHYNLGKALHAAGDPAGALREYETAVQLEPGFADAHVNLANLLAETGRPAEAQAELDRALALDSGDAGSHYNLGLVLFRSGQFKAALEQYQSALRLDPSAAPTRDALATTLFRLGRTDEAIGEYERLLRDQPRYAPAENNLGNVLLALGRLDQARSHLEAALRLNPDYAQAHTNLGELLLQQGQTEAAQGQFEAALRMNNADAEAHFQLGNIMGMKGRMTEAMAQWRESLRLRPNDAEAENNLGLALAQQGRTQEAIAHLRAALRIDPTYERAKANLQDLQR